MRPVDGEILGLLADMPFLDRLEMVALSGWSRGGGYRAIPRLEDAGLIASVPHGTGLTPPTRRFHLTAAGIRRLAHARNTGPEDLLRDHPVSARWRRVLLERLDAVAVVYRIASAMANTAHPVRFRWYRAMPMDAAVTLPGGRTVGIVRQGPTTDRTGFSKRLWRLTHGPQPGAVLLIAPDEVRLRHARRFLAQAPVEALFALEREAVAASPDDPVWRLRSVNAAVSLRAVIDRMDRRGALPVERPLTRGASPPPDVDEHAPGGDAPGYLLPALLRPTEKRALDLVSDWPWLGLRDLAALLGVSRPRASQLIAALEAFGMMVRTPASGRRLALTDLALAMLARRDRVAVGGARKRWSAAPYDAGDWRSVSGRRSRQLLRDAEHTTAVHGFIAALATHARSMDCETDQLDPPVRASRYFRHFGGMRSVHPDAFGILRRKGVVWPFFLEWERRAVRPVTMAERLAPYLRYYSSHRPIDDHGARPAVLVVFHEDLAATHFLRVALEEMVRTRTPVPLMVSHRGLLEREGPLGRAWLTPGEGFEPRSPFLGT
ncbi:MAG: replication-relaxation family protein [Chloroflexi bacterium]|nr:replication-relaxation family protein [Chloroflexota bacterium]